MRRGMLSVLRRGTGRRSHKPHRCRGSPPAPLPCRGQCPLPGAMSLPSMGQPNLGDTSGTGRASLLDARARGGRVMLQARDPGGKFGAVSPAGPGDGRRGGPVALLLLRPRASSPGASGDPALSPPHPPATDEGATAGTGPGEAAGSGITCVLSHPKRQPQDHPPRPPPGPPIAVTVPFSPQHERARGLRARRRHRLHQHQLAEVRGVEAGPSPRRGESPQHPQGFSPSQLGLWGCTEASPRAPTRRRGATSPPRTSPV